MADTKDWTWVVDRACPDCGFDGPALQVADAPDLLRGTAEQWSRVLRASEVRRRPAPDTWSRLEYAAHVRDLHGVIAGRLRTMLAETDPVLPGWDQDEAAAAYGEADPLAVELALIEAAGDCAGVYASLAPADLSRRGLRSDGRAFTVESLARYHLHDVVHHLWDVG